MPRGEFYARYYVGHKGKFGHEFLEFEITEQGQVSSAMLIDHTCAAKHMSRLDSAASAFVVALRQQLKLQKRHHDQKGSVCEQDSSERAKKDT